MVTEPRTFKVPRVKDNDLIHVEVNRTGIIETKEAVKYVLKKQKINDIEIPRGTELWVPGGMFVDHEFSGNVKAIVPGWKINELLRTMVIDQLRKKK